MARGNQRDKAREKNQAKLAQTKHKTSGTGSEQARDKENVAAIMRAKQLAAEARKAEAEAAKK